VTYAQYVILIAGLAAAGFLCGTLGIVAAFMVYQLKVICVTLSPVTDLLTYNMLFSTK